MVMSALQSLDEPDDGAFVAAVHWSAALVELDAVAAVSTGGQLLTLAAEADAEAEEADADADDADADADADD